MIQTPYIARQDHLSKALQLAGLPALALNPGPSLAYVTGLHFHLMERPVVGLFRPEQPVILVLPELEQAKIQALPYPIQAFFYTDDPAEWPAVFRQAATAAGLHGKVGVEPTRLRYLELKYLEQAAPQVEFTSAEAALEALRIQKDDNELAAMRKAVLIAQQALLATLPVVKIGMSERQVASELTMQLLRHGSDAEIPFSPIVASGPNSANPHAVPSDRPLTPGDLLIVDWGASWDGYFSDLTRTFAIGEVEPEMARIATIVEAANQAGRAACQPGIPAGQVDQVARQVIEQAGYGAQFFHRTGHGLGAEAHEAPYIRAGNPQILAAGMTFTVEPGIYLAGRGGVRIEDNVAITATGVETFSDLPRMLQRIG